ncbi:PAS domain S-box protein [Dokdonella sp.]|uniref:helix-turn-helix transcriptional regulator n=1 Tax=Dokdonella sp. TaxID=2291710 RepID=UPI002F4066E5
MSRTPTPPASLADFDQLRQILAGLAEGVILVGRKRDVLWANASACALHGVKTPSELGGTTAGYRRLFRLKYRNHHPLRAAQYPLERVAAGEIFDGVIVDVQAHADPDSHWVHRVRGQTILSPQGTADLHALFITDMTEWASAEHRFEKAFGANPAPAVICRIGDLRYVKVNPGFLQMTGFTSEQVVGRSTYELDVLAHAAARDDAIARLSAWQTIPQMEAELIAADGSGRLVVVAGQPIEMAGEPCMLFTFIDLEPRRKVELALRHSEEKFAKAFAMSPLPAIVCRADTLEITDVNEAASALAARPTTELAGRTLDDLGLLGSGPERKRVAAQLGSHGRVRNAELTLALREGESIDVLVSADTVRIEDRDCVLIAYLDITHRKRRELELADAVEAIMQDASWFSRPLIERLARVRRGDAPVDSAELASLTRREGEVLALIGEGLADKTIAARLGLSPRTVRNHATSIYAKLGVRSRAEAMLWVRERGMRGLPATAERSRRGHA